MTMTTAGNGDSGVLARVARIATLLAGIALAAMAAVEAWQVFARYALNDSPGWTEPVALFLLNVAMSLGAAAGVRAQSHFGFYVFVNAAPAMLRSLLRAVACVVVGGVGIALAFWATLLLLDGLGIAAAGSRLPQSAAFAPMALGGLLMCVFAIERLFIPAAIAEP